MSDRMSRFMAKITLAPNGCWLIGGYINSAGYGQFSMGGRSQWAHRAAWELHMGPIPAGLWVLHKCDIRSCVNPDHLYLGTHADNTRDMVERGRQARGSRNGASGPRAHPPQSRDGYGLQTECLRGHPYPSNRRHECRICKTVLQRERRAAIRAAAS